LHAKNSNRGRDSDPADFACVAFLGLLAGQAREAYPAGLAHADDAAYALLIPDFRAARRLMTLRMKRQNLYALIAVLSVIAAGSACGPGSPPDLSAPSGGGGSAPTQTEVGVGMALTSIAGPPILTLEPPASPGAAIPETRRLTLEYPPGIRVGDSDIIRLTLEVDDLGGLTPTAELAGQVVRGETVQIPDLYESHNVFAEAQLDLAGAEIRPSEPIREPLQPGQSATFYWSIRPTRSGTFRGTVWLHLRFVNKLTGAESRIAVSAQPIQVEASRLFGLTGNVARTAGGIGSVLGAILGFPFVDDILKWLFRRKVKSPPNS
jgi:hypothetical protein